MTQPLSFFQQRAAQKQAEHEREFGDTPERTEVVKQICAILNNEVLPVLAPLPPAVTEELGFALHTEWVPGEARFRGVVIFRSPSWLRLEVPLVTQPASYSMRPPTVAPGWTGDSISLTELREHLTRLCQTVYEATPEERRNCFSCKHSDPSGSGCDALSGDESADEAVVDWLNGPGQVKPDGTPDPESDGCPGYDSIRVRLG